MDAYKTPSSNLDIKLERPFQPIKALVIGLLISVVLATLLSTVIFVAMAINKNVLLSGGSSWNELLTSTTYLLIDLCTTFIMLYFAGYMTSKYTPNQEIKYAMILSSINFVIYFPFLIFSEEKMAIWYIVLSTFSIFIAIYMGASSRIKKLQRQQLSTHQSE